MLISYLTKIACHLKLSTYSRSFHVLSCYPFPPRSQSLNATCFGPSDLPPSCGEHSGQCVGQYVGEEAPCTLTALQVDITTTLQTIITHEYCHRRLSCEVLQLRGIYRGYTLQALRTHAEQSFNNAVLTPPMLSLLMSHPAGPRTSFEYSSLCPDRLLGRD